MINQHSVLPVYYQIKSDLLARIRGREFPPGARLPSESVLSRHYRVSRQAMRHALGELESQGVIRPRRGVGWFVNGDRFVKPLPLLSSYTAQMAALSSDSSVHVVSSSMIPASDKVSRALAIDIGADVIRVERIGMILEEPVTLLRAYLPADICPDLDPASLDSASLYALLEEECGVRFVRASSRLEVVFADPQQADLLRIKEGHPLLRLEGTSFTDAGRAGEFTSLDYVHERFSFTIESYRDDATQRTVIAAG